MEDKYILVLDLDGVLFNSLKIIDSIVKTIEPKATDSYLISINRELNTLNAELQQLEYERVNANDRRKEEILRRIKVLKELCREHFDLKDQVLEEVYNKYRDRIAYKEIYCLKNMFEGVVDTLWTIYQSGVYDRIIGASHYNVESEGSSKIMACGKHLPMMEVITIPFHQEPYFDPVTGKKNENRKRTNKFDYLRKILNLDDLSRVVFIDDTLSIIREAQDMGVEMCYHKRPFDNINELLMRAYFNTCKAAGQKQIKRLHLER